MPLTIDKNECDRCGTCISVCPCNALLLIDELTILHDQCTQCGTCMAICPVGALMIEK